MTLFIDKVNITYIKLLSWLQEMQNINNTQAVAAKIESAYGGDLLQIGLGILKTLGSQHLDRIAEQYDFKEQNEAAIAANLLTTLKENGQHGVSDYFKENEKAILSFFVDDYAPACDYHSPGQAIVTISQKSKGLSPTEYQAETDRVTSILEGEITNDILHEERNQYVFETICGKTGAVFICSYQNLKGNSTQ